jgi:hypothetical protein
MNAIICCVCGETIPVHFEVDEKEMQSWYCMPCYQAKENAESRGI